MNRHPHHPGRPPEARGRRALLRAVAAAAAAVPFAALGWWGLVVARAAESLPPGPRRLLVGPVASLRARGTTVVQTPTGSVVRVHAPTAPGERWLALRDECPHLGCRLAWQAASAEYVCPCHAGRFDAQGLPLAGPPAVAGLGMLRCELEVERGRLFLVLGESAGSARPQARADRGSRAPFSSAARRCGSAPS